MKRHLLVLLALLVMIIIGALKHPNQPVVPLPKSGGERASVTAASDYFTSPAGIIYGKDWSGKFPTRVAHIMAHTQPDPSKPKHSVFVEKSREGVLALLDEAWKKRGPPKREGGSRGRDIYDIDMGRVVGTEGERRIKMVTEKDSGKIVTAYPTR